MTIILIIISSILSIGLDFYRFYSDKPLRYTDGFLTGGLVYLCILIALSKWFSA